ncbi:MAG: hypothetical protein CLLPBCKN_004896 [Chroococcidiopsis cubana SAG 39.79]|jgi:hypothetical protein|nr:hypothetical protein [Chroococcidiopsis cubana]MDZ4875500.1 hypothetical protein [Chroococcidiopsis cubana SAG 39.79]PSB64145.1 hypothetical protein C7B79_10925 [Chroococcidiopsis cubana CCALA 043]
MRAFVFHLATDIEHCSVSSVLYKAVTQYAQREHKISYHEYAKDLKLETPDELRLQLTLADARRRSLVQDVQELRYQIKQLQKTNEELINAGFRKS